MVITAIMEIKSAVPSEEVGFMGNEKSKNDLYLFLHNVLSLSDICLIKENLRTLVIIGQPNVTSVNAISILIHLQELWVVECKVKDISSLSKCTKLEKLYLYSNEIENIPDLSKCSHLTTIFLSGNKIRRLKNLNKLENVQEVNIANNKLKRINNILRRNSKLIYINLAGNCLYHLKDIQHLSVLQNLESVVFADPLYGECPFVNLCNYRCYVIYWLPSIKSLDHFKIYEEEKHWVTNFFKKKIIYYNILLHTNLNTYLKSMKNIFIKHRKKMLCFKDQVHARKIECIQKQSTYKMQHIKTFIEIENKKLKEQEDIESMHLQVCQHKLRLTMHLCGNINFIEYTINIESEIIKRCQLILEQSLGSFLRNNVGISGVKLHRVTNVINKEINEYHVWNCMTCNFLPHVNETSLKLLAFPVGVKSVQEWPLDLFTNEFYIQKEILLTDCLGVADAHCLNDIFVRREESNNANINDISIRRRRVCILVQVPISLLIIKRESECKFHANNQSSIDQTCRNYIWEEPNLSTSIFVVEYEYLFERNLKCNIYKFIATSTSGETIDMDLSFLNISSYVNMDESTLCKIVKLNLSGQGIKTIDTCIDMPRLKELDISHNQFTEFPNSQTIKHLRKLNISFNNIQSLHTTEVLPILEDFNISWNNLTQCCKSFQVLGSVMPNLNKLNVENNPFEDIIDHKIIIRLAQSFLPKLCFVNNITWEELSTFFQKITLCSYDLRKQKSNWIENSSKSVLNILSNSDIELSPSSLIDKKKKNYLKHIHISSKSLTELNVLNNFPNVLVLCAFYCSLSKISFPKPLKQLVKLNLSSNCISILDGLTQANLPALQYLDLTDNLIVSLQPMGSNKTLLEFYCGHNEIKMLQDIDNLRNWHNLLTIDLSNNPVNLLTVCRNFIIYHLPSVKYVSGEHVEESETSEAQNMFGNILNKNVLMTIHNTYEVKNIRQLSMVNCSIKKVDLSSTVLCHLESLDLSKNQITCLWGLHGLQNLHTLCMSYNQLNVSNVNKLETHYSFPNLCTLYLDNNCITSLIWMINCQMPVLKHLFLHHNYLANIEGLQQYLTLETLVLDYNKIETLKEENFRNSKNITFLSLENNKISHLHFVNHLLHVKRLFLARNHINDEAEFLHLSSLRNIEELTFIGNPLCRKINHYKFSFENFTEVKMIDGYFISHNKSEISNNYFLYIHNI